MDRLTWISYFLVLLFCISATSNVYGDELSEGLELMNDETVKMQGDAAFPDSGAAANTKADIAFLVHVNKGTEKSEMENLVNFLKYLLTNADIKSGAVRVALAYYKLNVRVDFDFNEYTTKVDIFNALDQFMESKARSPKANVAGALKSLPRILLNEKKGKRPDAKTYVILITDLETTVKRNLVRNNAQILKDTGAQVLTVGVGLPDSAELRTIASEPSGLHSFFADYETFHNIIPNVVRMVPPLEAPRVTIPTIPATTVDPRIYTRCLKEKADLVFILDTSTRVTEADFRTMLQFSKQLVNDLDIDSGNVRVGFLTSSKKVKVHFHLRRYQKKVDILNAINRIVYVNGPTNTAEALKIPRAMFLPNKGDRPDVTNIAVLLTDARSNLNSRKTILQAKRARDKFYKIIAVGIGFPGEQELKRIASDGLSFSTQDVRTLSTLLTPVAQAICSEIDLDYFIPEKGRKNRFGCSNKQ